ncbi:MAG: AMP-binding protein [Sphingobium sp.]
MTFSPYAEPPQDSINAALKRAVDEAPDRIFLDFSGETYSFSDVDRLSTQIAHGLIEAGVKAGEAVATLLFNGVEIVATWFALNKIGAIFAPVNTAFKGEYLVGQIADCGARIVVADARIQQRLAEVEDRLPDLAQVYVTGGDPQAGGGRVTYRPFADLRTGRFETIPDEALPGTVSMLVYTSGTTGKSKGCMIPHNQVCNMGWNGFINGRIRREDVVFSPLPLFHMNAIGVIVGGALIAQARAAIVEKFSVSGFWPEIRRSGATVVGMLGSMVELIANAPDSEDAAACFGQLRQVNAAPFPPATVRKWEERFGAKGAGARAYGMSEAGTIATLKAGDDVGPGHSSGKVGYDFDVMIADDAGNPMRAGEAGEILCRPNRPNIMFRGYWNRHDATIEAFRDMWFHTGDIGKVDESNYLYFVDRKKDYIRRRGENISTLEVEAIFRKHPAVRDVAVHSVRSPIGEDDVKVTIELDPDNPVSEEALCRWSIDELPYFAVPQYVEFREELPRGPTGKVLKNQLREEGKTAFTWDREEAGIRFDRQ